nr:GDSL esterase/lipase 5 [Ipomoea batatas]
MASSFFIYFLIPFLSFSLPSAANAGECRTAAAGERRPALFIFGDSFMDSGNNNYINTTTLDQANFGPYGETFFDAPTGRFSDGRLISDFIAEYAGLALVPPFLQPAEKHEYYGGANFASAGAGALVQTFQGEVIDLGTQLEYFNKVKAWYRGKIGSAESRNAFARAVYLFSIGTNDYLSPFLTDSKLLTSYSHSHYVDMVIGNLTQVIQEIYRNGGRKFGLLNLGDLGCVPGMRQLNPPTKSGCLPEVSKLSRLHNRALQKMLVRMGNQFKGFRYVLYDFNHNLKQRINHPSKFGFKEGKIACCGTGRFRGVFSCGGKRPVREFEVCENPKEYVFWDSYHLTESVHKQMADHMWNQPKLGLYTLKNLFQCL